MEKIPFITSESARVLVDGGQECRNHCFISIVVCTVGLRATLTACLESLVAQNCANCEIILVLNGPPDGEVSRAVAKYPIRLLNEVRRGVSAARNHAVSNAQGEVVAFVDDDVFVHPNWIHEIIKGFENPVVACVTGRIVPHGPVAFSSDKIKRYYASDGALSKWTLDASDPSCYMRALGDPAGFGCNMAFRRKFLQTRCSFPEDLGAGSLTGASDEPYMFLQVLKHGFHIHHTPDAIVTHYFEQDDAKQKPRIGQLYSAVTALVVKLFVEEKGLRLAALKWVFSGLKRRVARLLSRKTITSEPQELLSSTEKLKAYLRGPVIYWKSSRLRKSTTRKSGKDSAPPSDTGLAN